MDLLLIWCITATAAAAPSMMKIIRHMTGLCFIGTFVYIVNVWHNVFYVVAKVIKSYLTV